MARVCTAFVHANDESAGIIRMMVMVLLMMMRMMTMMMMVMMMMMMVIVVMMMVMMVMVLMMMRVMMIMTMTVDSEGMTTPASMIEWHPSVHRRRTHKFETPRLTNIGFQNISNSLPFSAAPLPQTLKPKSNVLDFGIAGNISETLQEKSSQEIASSSSLPNASQCL